MSTETASPDLSTLLYRSEAFAEDLDDGLTDTDQAAPQRSRLLRTALLLGLPLALVVLGSASALAWA